LEITPDKREEVEEQIQNHISRLTTPIFNKISKETSTGTPLEPNDGWFSALKTYNNIPMATPQSSSIFLIFLRKILPKKPSNHTLQKYKKHGCHFQLQHTTTHH